jgi:hypothetical protein
MTQRVFNVLSRLFHAMSSDVMSFTTSSVVPDQPDKLYGSKIFVTVRRDIG